MFASAIFQSFCDLQVMMLSIERAWAHRREVVALEHAVSDARHHCCSASAFVSDLERDGEWAPQEAFELMTDVDRFAAHEAYLSLIMLGQLLRHGIEDGFPGSEAMRRGMGGLTRTLDTLEPFVNGADAALRRVLLEDEPIERFLDESIANVEARAAGQPSDGVPELVLAEGTTPTPRTRWGDEIDEIDRFLDATLAEVEQIGDEQILSSHAAESLDYTREFRRVE